MKAEQNKILKETDKIDDLSRKEKLEKLDKAIEEMNIENATPKGYRQVENEIARLENQNLYLNYSFSTSPV